MQRPPARDAHFLLLHPELVSSIKNSESSFLPAPETAKRLIRQSFLNCNVAALPSSATMQNPLKTRSRRNALQDRKARTQR